MQAMTLFVNKLVTLKMKAGREMKGTLVAFDATTLILLQGRRPDERHVGVFRRDVQRVEARA